MSDEIEGPPCPICGEPMQFVKVTRKGRGDGHFLRCYECPVTTILTREGYNETWQYFASFDKECREAAARRAAVPPAPVQQRPQPAKPAPKSLLDEFFHWLEN